MYGRARRRSSTPSACPIASARTSTPSRCSKAAARGRTSSRPAGSAARSPPAAARAWRSTPRCRWCCAAAPTSTPGRPRCCPIRRPTWSPASSACTPATRRSRPRSSGRAASAPTRRWRCRADGAGGDGRRTGRGRAPSSPCRAAPPSSSPSRTGRRRRCSRSAAGTPMPTRPTRTAPLAAGLRQLDLGLAALRAGLRRERRLAAHRGRRRQRVRPRGRGQRHARHRPRHRRRRLRPRRRGPGRPRRRRLAGAGASDSATKAATCAVTTDLRAVLKGVLGDHLQIASRSLESRGLPDSAKVRPLQPAARLTARSVGARLSRAAAARERATMRSAMRSAAPRCAAANASAGGAAPRRSSPSSQRQRRGDAFFQDRRDPQRRAGGERQLGGVGEVEGVRAHHHRAAAGRGLDQVLAAERREAAAEQGDIGERVLGRHLAHRVAEPDIGARRFGGRRSAQALRRDSVKPASAISAATASKRCGWRGTTTSSGRGSGTRAPGREQARLLALARDRREHHRTRDQRAFQRWPSVDQRRFGREVELEVADDADARRRRRRAGARRRPRSGRRPPCKALERRAQQRIDARAAAPAALAQAGVGEHHRQARARSLRRARWARSRSPSGPRRPARSGARKRRAPPGVSHGSQAWRSPSRSSAVPAARPVAVPWVSSRRRPGRAARKRVDQAPPPRASRRARPHGSRARPSAPRRR